MSLGLKIKRYIESKGLKLSSVAEKSNISISAFSAIMHDKRKISAEEYFAICEALNVSVSFFYDIKPIESDTYGTPVIQANP